MGHKQKNPAPWPIFGVANCARSHLASLQGATLHNCLEVAMPM